MTLDSTDLRILYFLQQDGRISNQLSLIHI